MRSFFVIIIIIIIEIIVKLVKRCLKKILGNARLTFKEFETILIEIEAVLNFRPLTCSHDELSEPLNHRCLLQVSYY